MMTGRLGSGGMLRMRIPQCPSSRRGSHIHPAVGVELVALALAFALALVLATTGSGVAVSAQPAWSSVVSTSPTLGTSVSSLIGGVEDPTHMGVNCSCVDRHKGRILYVPDLLDSSYAGSLISRGAQRAAIDMGVQLRITPSKAASTASMAQWVSQAVNLSQSSNMNPNNNLFPGYPGPPDWVISGLPSSGPSTPLPMSAQPLASLLSMYASAGIPFSSVHSGSLPLIRQLSLADMGHVWHVGADNDYTGQVAAEQLISQMQSWVAQQAPFNNIPLTGLFTPVALCLSDMVGMEAGDDRCQGFATAWSQSGLNVTVVVGSVNTVTADYHPVLALIQSYTVTGRALPIFAVDDEVMGVVRSSIAWGGPVLTNPVQHATAATDPNTNLTVQVSVSPLWIATVDVSPATAADISTNGVVRVALDQQPFIQGYLSVALSALAVRTGTYPSQLLYQTGPVVVDRSTTDLIPHAKLEQAGFPECTAAANSNNMTGPPSDVPCFNRSTVKFQSTFHAAAGPAGAWAAPLRSGIYQSSVDMRVRVDDLLQTAIDPNVNMAGYTALNNQNNLPVAERSYQGMMTVRRGANQVSLPMVYNLTQHGMPIVTINNFFGACCAPLSLWQNVTHQAISHVGSDDATISRDVAQHLLSMGRCTKVALLDPDGSWNGAWQYELIVQLVEAGGVNASFVFADSSNPAASLSAISLAKGAGFDCWLLGTNSAQLGALVQLNIAGNPAHHIGVWDFNGQVLDLLQQGSLAWSMSQGMFYQGYLPPMFLTLLWLTGGPERGNRLLKTNNMTNEDSYYSYVNFPYVESGPQFLTPRTRGLSRLANCAPAVAAPVPPTMTLPALVDIKSFPFAQMAFPVCAEPPPHYYAVITTPDMVQRFQPNYDSKCPAGAATPSPSWCAFGPANSTNTPPLSYTLDSSSYVPTSLVVVLLNYAQQLVPTALTSQWRALLNNNNLLVSSAVVAQNSSWPGFDYSANSTSLLILGSSSAPLVDSAATFPAFGLQAPPGTTVSINFAVTLLDGQRIQTNTMTLVQPSCVPGQYAQVRAGSAGRTVPVCTPCQSGYTSYSMNADSCAVITTYLPVSGAAVVQGLIGLVMLLFVVALVCMALNHDHKMIKSFSPVYCCISLVGAAMVLCGAILMLDTSAHTMVRSATASVYLFNMGFTLAFGAVWTKLFRLFRIFNNPLLHMIVIPNAQLFATLAAMVAADVIIISVWLSISPYYLRTDKYQTCVSDKSDIFNGILIGTKGALMLSAAWLTYRTRAIPSRFNESKAITLTIYNTALIAVITCFLWLGLEGAVGSVVVVFIKAVGIMLGGISFVLLLFSPMLRLLYKQARGASIETAALNVSATGRRSSRPLAGRKSSAGRSGSGKSVGVDSLVQEHGGAFELGKGDVGADLEEGLAGLLAGSDGMEAVIRELNQLKERGQIHPLQERILLAHHDMVAHRVKLVEHYRKYRKSIMTMSLVNAQYYDAKKSGTLDRYETLAAEKEKADRAVKARKTSVTAAAAAAGAGAGPATGAPHKSSDKLSHATDTEQQHEIGIGLGLQEAPHDTTPAKQAPHSSASSGRPLPLPLAVSVSGSGSVARTSARPLVSPSNARSSVSAVGFMAGSASAAPSSFGRPASSSISMLPTRDVDLGTMVDSEAVSTPTHAAPGHGLDTCTYTNMYTDSQHIELELPPDRDAPGAARGGATAAPEGSGPGSGTNKHFI